jgi:copper transport protein
MITRRWGVRLLVGLVVPLAWLVIGAAPAWAHADLVATDPANGAHLDRSPSEVTLRFSQPVTPVSGGIRLLDTRGRQVGAAPAALVPGKPEQVRLPVSATLPDGYYVLAWRVVSLDSHPVGGALTFSVGAAVGAGPAALPGSGTSPSLSVAFWLVRGTGYLALALLIGGAYFLLVCQRGPADDRSPRLLRAGWVGALVATGGALLLQGPYVAGRSLGAVPDLSLLGTTLQDNYGLVVAVRLVLVVAAWPVVTRLVTRVEAPAEVAVAASSAGRSAVATVDRPAAPAARRPAPAPVGERVGAGILGVALAGTWAMSGHARAGSDVPLAVLADTVHLLAMSVWIGGLVFLVATALAPRQPLADAVATLLRFSRTALAAVVVLVLTGIFQAWRELAGSGALTGSPWVGLLVFKIAAFGLLVVLAAGSRSLAHSRYLRVSAAGTGRSARRRQRAEEVEASVTLARLRRPVGYEVALAVGVLGLTAALVATSPQPSPLGLTAAPVAYSGPYRGTVPLTHGNTVDIWMDPARPGHNELVLNVRRPDAASLDVLGLEARITLPAVDAAVPVVLRKTGAGQYVGRDLSVPSAGVCRLQIRVRTGEFDAESVTLDIPVR